MLKITKVDIYKTSQNLETNEKFIISVEIDDSGMTWNELSKMTYSDASKYRYGEIMNIYKWIDLIRTKWIDLINKKWRIKK